MDGLLWLLVFGVLFFAMMRFGCGAHIMHGGHGTHDGKGSNAESAEDLQNAGKDPVCGMEVDADKGYSMHWSGRTYRFCSRDCLDKFEAAPAKFTAPATG